jgi:Xaa-Pro dipeptidase
MLLAIPREEHLDRQKRFYQELQAKQIDAAVLFAPTDIFYLTGFHYFITERPIGFFMDPSARSHLFVPLLEEDHALECAYVDCIHSYPEYPGLRHPMEYLQDILNNAGLQNKIIGMDADGYGSPMGYRGPKLSALYNTGNFVSVYGLVEKMRTLKSPAEVELMKESCRWANLAHRLVQKYAKAGISELEITSRATTEATICMLETLGANYRPHGSTATAYFRGQVGKRSAFPHVVTQNAVLKKGDNLITMAKAGVWGYHCELERTMFVQAVSPEQEKYFHLAAQAQEIALAQIKPGRPVSSVEKAVRSFFRENGLEHLAPHHSGHAMGILEHEAPFFDLGDDTLIAPGMIFSVEPGIYLKDLGGFRFSDTVLVTQTGSEILTYYPRDLESLICF